MPLSATVILLATLVVTVATHNLAHGVIVGVVVARQRGKDVRIVGLNEPSRAWHTRLSGQLGADL